MSVRVLMFGYALFAAPFGCSKGPAPAAPISQLESADIAEGQSQLSAVSCASAAYTDSTTSSAGPLVYRTMLEPKTATSQVPLTLSVEPAHKASVLAAKERDQPEEFSDEFLVRTEFVATGRFDGEKIVLEADNLRINVNRVPGVSSPFYVGTIGIMDKNSVALSCWANDARRDFSYDRSTGKCVDKNGEIGRNRWTLAYIRDNQDGECTDFGRVKINEENFSYPSFSWNLKGADLSNSDFVFSTFVDSSFEGANLIGLTLGYAQINGTMDLHTRLPSEICHKTSRTTFECGQ